MLLAAGQPKRRWWLYPTGVALLLALGISITFYMAGSIAQNKARALTERAQSLADIISPADVASLSGTADDLANPNYARLQALLASLRSANQDVRFIRLVGLGGNGVPFFLADSESRNSPDHVNPGEEYPEVTASLAPLLRSQASGFTQITDAWGNWFAGYAAIPDPHGAARAFVLLSSARREYVLDIVRYAGVPLLFTIIVLAIIISTHYALERERQYTDQKDSFISIASHELRAPLTGLRWATENLLKETGAQSAESRQVLMTMHNDCVALINNLNNLLDLTSRNALEPSISTNLQNLVQATIDSFRLTAESRGVTLAVDPSVDAKIILTVAAETLRHILANLLSNAIHYTAANTTVRVSYELKNGWHALSVSDHGPGLSPAEQQLIFGGFDESRRLKRGNEHGVGIGLYLARSLAAALGGRIGVASAPGQGSTFTIFLPAA